MRVHDYRAERSRSSLRRQRPGLRVPSGIGERPGRGTATRTALHATHPGAQEQSGYDLRGRQLSPCNWPDAGVTWATLLDAAAFPTPDVLDAAINPDNSSILYIGVRRQGVFKSYDTAENWETVPAFTVELCTAQNSIWIRALARDAAP